MRVAGLLFLASVVGLAGCVLPQHGSHWERSALPLAEQGKELVRVPRGVQPRVAFASVLIVQEHGASTPGTTFRIERGSASVGELSRTIPDRITANSGVPVIVRSDLLPALLPFVAEIDAPIVIEKGQDDPEFWNAPLPAILRNAPVLTGLKEGGFTHCLIVVGRTTRASAATTVDWAIAGGPRGALPTPMIEHKTFLRFDVFARLYDLSSTDAVSSLELRDDATESSGVVAIFPWAIVVDESKHFAAMGMRVGEEFGRRWVMVEESGANTSLPRQGASP